jgi:hypothetical protein
MTTHTGYLQIKLIQKGISHDINQWKSPNYESIRKQKSNKRIRNCALYLFATVLKFMCKTSRFFIGGEKKRRLAVLVHHTASTKNI